MNVHTKKRNTKKEKAFRKFVEKRRLAAIALVVCTALAILPLGVAADDAGSNVTNEVELGDAYYTSKDDTSTFSFPEATISFQGSVPSILTVTVSDGTVSAPSDVAGATKVTDLSGKSVTLLFDSSSSVTTEQIQTILQSMTFTYAAGMSVTVTADANTTNIVSQLTNNGVAVSDAKLTQWSENGHYYLYVPHVPTYADNSTFLSWREAYDEALGYTLGGKKGYLVTIAKSGEQAYLANLADTNVWTGATSLYLQSEDGTTSAKLDGTKLIGNGVLTFADGFVATATEIFSHRTEQAYKTGTSKLNAYYYWSAGPESGQTIDVDGGIVTVYSNPAAAVELNGYPQTKADYTPKLKDGLTRESCTAVYVGSKTGLNDITEANFKYGNNLDLSAQGYFVEFGDWTSQDTAEPTLVATDTQLLSSAPQIPRESVTVDVTLSDKTYDGSAAAVTTVTAEINAATETLSESDYSIVWYWKNVDGTYAALTAAPKGAGTYKAVVSITRIGYKGTVEKEMTIDPKKVKITGAKADSKVYDGTTSAVLAADSSYEIDGLITGDQVTVDTSRVTASFSDSAVGKGKTVTFAGFSLIGDDAANYVLEAQPTAIADITKATEDTKDPTEDGKQSTDKPTDTTDDGKQTVDNSTNKMSDQQGTHGTAASTDSTGDVQANSPITREGSNGLMSLFVLAGLSVAVASGVAIIRYKKKA